MFYFQVTILNFRILNIWIKVKHSNLFQLFEFKLNCRLQLKVWVSNLCCCYITFSNSRTTNLQECKSWGWSEYFHWNQCICLYTKSKYFDVIHTSWHISTDISWHICFFIKKERSWINESHLLVTFWPSQTLFGVLKPLLLLKFCCPKIMISTRMKQFVKKLHDYKSVGEIR